MIRKFILVVFSAWAFFTLSGYAFAADGAPVLPPAIGPEHPTVEHIKGDDGLYHQTWFNETFLNLGEDFEDARAEGKRFAVIFEQRGCGYCVKMHN